MDKVEKIMAILNDEFKKEVACYQKALQMKEQTNDPVKKIKYKYAQDMFGAHVAAINHAIIRINQELYKDEG